MSDKEIQLSDNTDEVDAKIVAAPQCGATQVFCCATTKTRHLCRVSEEIYRVSNNRRSFRLFIKEFPVLNKDK